MPVLGRMSDQEDSVRLMASQCFAKLVAIMPLEVINVVQKLLLFSLTQSGTPNPPTMSPSLIERRTKERDFLEQLLNTNKLENYKVPIPIKADLRKYQQVSKNCLT